MYQKTKQCSWDSKKQELSAPEDAKRKEEKALQSAAWYKDEFGSHMADKGRKKAPEEFADESTMTGINRSIPFMRRRENVKHIPAPRMSLLSLWVDLR